MSGMVEGRVVAQHDHLDALQAHHPIGFGPAPVIADAHAHDAAEATPDPETKIARLEIALLQMLVNAVGLWLGMARQMHLAVFADDRSVAADQDRSVEAARSALLLPKLGVAEIKADAQLLGLVEKK